MTVNNVTNTDYITNKGCFFTFYSSNNLGKQNVSWFTLKYEAATLF